MSRSVPAPPRIVVIAGPAAKDIISVARRQRIVAAPAEHDVVSVSDGDGVISTAAGDIVVAVGRGNDVVSAAAVDNVIPSARGQNRRQRDVLTDDHQIVLARAKHADALHRTGGKCLRLGKSQLRDEQCAVVLGMDKHVRGSRRGRAQRENAVDQSNGCRHHLPAFERFNRGGAEGIADFGGRPLAIGNAKCRMWPKTPDAAAQRDCLLPKPRAARRSFPKLSRRVVWSCAPAEASPARRSPSQCQNRRTASERRARKNPIVERGTSYRSNRAVIARSWGWQPAVHQFFFLNSLVNGRASNGAHLKSLYHNFTSDNHRPISHTRHARPGGQGWDSRRPRHQTTIQCRLGRTFFVIRRKAGF